MRILLDTGPWVALLCRGERNHHWSRAQFARASAPLLTCEAVLAEVCFLLARAGLDPAKALEFVERDVVRIAFGLQEEVDTVRSLFSRYENVPASLADACLIRMSELHDPCVVLTLDSDFRIYRRHGRKAIPLWIPD